MSRLSLLLVLCVFVSLGYSQVTFTGNAFKDFNLSALTTEAAKSLLHLNSSDSLTITPSAYMAARGWKSGIDILNVYFQYDYHVDTLFVGVDCDGICGDVDGDGNPSKSSDPSALDQPNMCFTEQLSLMIWPEPPAAWTPNPQDFTYFFPQIVAGISASACLPNGFGAFEFNGWQNCVWPSPLSGGESCQTQQNKVTDPSNGGYGGDLSVLYPAGSAKPVPKPVLFANPNSSFPDIEFKLLNFSNYPGFTFKSDGTNPIKFGFSLYSASTSDSVGEDRVFPSVYSIPCPVQDACGVCGGNNSTCWDCERVPFGGKKYDACGVCGGNNSTCWDCKKIPNGPNRYDACGVCGGNNSTCWDCKKIPNGPNRYDACGVCGGNNATCWDCKQIPNGPNRLDACGVCAGDNSTCWDCAYTPNGPNRYDACGVCAGDNSTCWDCAYTPNGNLTYDRFGICGGSGEAGCDDIPNSKTVYDLCGVCGGDNSTCTCLEYLGCSLCEVDYALLRWSLGASLIKLNDTLDILYAIKHELPYYDYKRQILDVVDFIDTLHGFADNCLDHFDFAQYWFADFLAGHCNEDGTDCETLELGGYRAHWDEESHSRQKGGNVL